MIDFVINEKAGGKKSVRAKKVIAEILDAKKIEYRFHTTEYSKHAIEITKDLCKNGAKTIVAVGGDGTINEVLNGLDDLSVNFGIIPTGSGNDFITSANIPLDVEKALNLILNGEAKPTDFLVCDNIRGINIIGTGIDVEILQRCEKNKLLKGKIKYFLSLLVSLFKFKFYNFRLADEPDKDRSALILCCGNGKMFGGGIPMCPEAVVDDNEMDFVMVNRVKRSAILKYLFKLMKGKILEQPATDFVRRDEVKALFDTPITVEIDGEIYENINFDVHIEKGKLRLFRP